jgi:aspartate-semialdehyde dehydrogenase
MTVKIPVSILGATGTVGQKFVRLLADHPWFEVAAVAASSASAGRPYGEVVRWRETSPLPERIAGLEIRPCTPPLPGPIVFSALDADVAGPIDESFAAGGAFVVTNARNHRMDPDVPLLIPEANAGHLALLERQQQTRGWSGGILANPNCSTAALALVLSPLHRAFGVEKLFVSTMQATSGAGYPGVPSLDILGNVIPDIPGEAEKLEREVAKILGGARDGLAGPAPLVVSAMTNRVPVEDGHTESISVGLARKASAEEIEAAWRDFRGSDEVAALPSAPPQPVIYRNEPSRPQPRRDVDVANGMCAVVGGLKSCRLLDWKFTVLGHNTVRGAAGASILNAELAVARGLLK